jgi:hypothetical protein
MHPGNLERWSGGPLWVDSGGSRGWRPAAGLGRKRGSCAGSHLLRVRLTERALCLKECASNARFRLR